MSSPKKVAKKRATTTASTTASLRKPATPSKGSVKFKTASKANSKVVASLPVKAKASAKAVKTAKSVVSSPKTKTVSTKPAKVVSKAAAKTSTPKRVVQNVSEKSKTSAVVNTSTPERRVARAIMRETSAKPVAKKIKPATARQIVVGESGENLLMIGDPGFLDSSEVHDDGDHAQHQQLREQAAIQERARQMARPETHPDFDGEHCLDCDIDIPELRLKLGRIRCVDCQQLIEDHEKRHSLTHASQPRFPEDWC